MHIPLHFLGSMPWRPSQSFRSSQTLTVKRQWTKRWLLLSLVCLHRGQRLQLYQPRLCNRPAVESLFCKACQAWFLTLGGAQAFQISLFMGDLMSPKNWNLYADSTEYCPFAVSFQVISSSTSTWRRTLWIQSSYSFFFGISDGKSSGLYYDWGLIDLS
jgi:hypothetical protein